MPAVAGRDLDATAAEGDSDVPVTGVLTDADLPFGAALRGGRGGEEGGEGEATRELGETEA
jgi:hypothetical protein